MRDVRCQPNDTVREVGRVVESGVYKTLVIDSTVAGRKVKVAGIVGGKADRRLPNAAAVDGSSGHRIGSNLRKRLRVMSGNPAVKDRHSRIFATRAEGDVDDTMGQQQAHAVSHPF